MAVEPRELALDLFVAMLAVNRWSLERVAALSANLKSLGFGDVAVVRAATVDDLAERLDRAGYSRGDFMTRLLAGRMRLAAVALEGGALTELVKLEESGQMRELSDLLLTLNGVGPEVIRNFLVLRS